MIAVMILAGGNGSRVGADRPKQFIEILDKPIVAYTIEIFQNYPEIDAIEVVCHKEWIEYLKIVVKKYGFEKVRWIVDGGNTFQRSVINGVENLKGSLSNDDIVMVHYGASPFTSNKIISEGIKVCREKGMSVSCTPCYQLMGTNDGDGRSCAGIDRDKYVQIACPQSYRFYYIKNIYERAQEKSLLDKIEPHTTSLMYALGETIFQSYGDQTNIKLTTMEDIAFFERWVKGCEI